ncbi:MAG: acyltransferase [Phycisphaerae bacterium]
MKPALTCDLPVDAALRPLRNPRLLQLDVLRGIAILLVLGRHAVISGQKAGYFWPIAGWWQVFGWSGVDLFFVLSGFLVGGLLCAEARDYGRIDVKRFIVRRGFKIWPLYYMFLGFIALGRLVGYPWRQLAPEEQTSLLWPSLLHIQNYMAVPRARFWEIPGSIWFANTFPGCRPFMDYLQIHMGLPRTHLWSLAVEEHFYLVLPFVLVLLLILQRGTAPLPRRRLAWLPAVCLFMMTLCTTMRCLATNLVPFPWHTHVYPTHMRVDGLFFGVLLAYLHHFQPWFAAWTVRMRWWLLLVGLLLIAPMMAFRLEPNAWVPAIGFTMLYLGYGCILLAALAMRIDWLSQARGLLKIPAHALRAIAWVGLFSYPIYLWHLDLGRFPVLYLLDTEVLDRLPAELRWLLATTLYLSLAIAGSALIGKLIERPMLLLRDRLFPGRTVAIDQLPRRAKVGGDAASAEAAVAGAKFSPRSSRVKQAART